MQLQDTGIAGGQRRQRRMQQERQGTVERTHDQNHAVGLAVDDPLVAGRVEKAWDRLFGRFHPALQLGLDEIDRCERGQNLEDLLLPRRLEVPADRFLKAGLVLLEHAAHAVQLLDAPVVGLCDVCCEVGPLGVEDLVIGVHANLWSEAGLRDEAALTAPGRACPGCRRLCARRPVIWDQPSAPS